MREAFKMITPTATYIAITIMKLGVVGSVSTAMIVAVKYFNTFDFKAKSKSKGMGGVDYDDYATKMESLRQGTRGGYKS